MLVARGTSLPWYPPNAGGVGGYLDSLARLGELPVQLACPGHNAVNRGLDTVADLVRATTDAVLDRDWTPDSGESNPFLHMGLHIAIREGAAADRPAGIRALRERLIALAGDEHDADHGMMECLAETLWEAQRAGLPPDEQGYLERVRRLIGR